MTKETMGDQDGPSKAAQGAQPTGQKSGGFFRRLFGRNTEEPVPVPDQKPGPAAPAVHGLANLRRMRVQDVAIPKVEIVSVPDSITREELVKVFADSALTRIPVFEGTLDTPVGLVHLKDFALSHGFEGNGSEFDVRAMLRPLLFVPPSMPIGVLLTKMQAERRHMALVIDEYGGVDGLVTIEDLIEQVIGEIEDEHDSIDDAFWVRERSGCYLALARAPLDEFEAATGIDLTSQEEIDSEEVDTLGGLVFMLAGRVPARGEVVPHPSGYVLEVVEADPRRVKRLRLRWPGRGGATSVPPTRDSAGPAEPARAPLAPTAPAVRAAAE